MSRGYLQLGGTKVAVEGRGCRARALGRVQYGQGSRRKKERDMLKEIKENQSLANHVQDFGLYPKTNRK